jgi:hypothetical protein
MPADARMNPAMTIVLKITVKDSAGPTVWTVQGDSPVTLARNGGIARPSSLDSNWLCVDSGKTSADGRKMSGEQVTLPSGAQFTFSTTNIKSCLSPPVSGAIRPHR